MIVILTSLEIFSPVLMGGFISKEQNFPAKAAVNRAMDPAANTLERAEAGANS